jgi:NAD(P)-dependent dehydrogenase (short-subunit alcohol dehydrogenase family)
MRKALVTGGTRGIGLSCVELLTKQGFGVYYTGRNEQATGFNGFIKADFSSREGITEFCSKISDLEIDVLVNNAGVNNPKPLSDIEFPDIDWAFNVNLIAPLKITKAVVPHMIQNNWGRVINIGSILGEISREFRSIYSITKSGLVGMTKAHSAEFAKSGVLVNCVAPGYLDTDLTRKNLGTLGMQEISRQIPVGHLGNPSDIAEIVSFLASESSSFITGQVFTVDGGYLGV